MPQLLIRGVPIEDVKTISTALVQELADICECGTDNFMLECVSTVSVFDGEAVASFPFVEVGWFERGQDVRDRFAQAVTRHLQGRGISEVEVAFVTYEEDKYYINGKPCK
jgi:hypothetical protein